MATVKVKFRASSVPGTEGTLYYHLIHQRCLRWISTDYHVFPDEWNDKKSAIIASNRNNRQAHLQLIQSQIDWEMKQMQRIIRDKDAEGIPYTIDDIDKEIQQLPPLPERLYLLPPTDSQEGADAVHWHQEQLCQCCQQIYGVSSSRRPHLLSDDQRDDGNVSGMAMEQRCRTKHRVLLSANPAHILQQGSGNRPCASQGYLCSRADR